MKINVRSVTMQDLIATIARDADDLATFECREEYSRRTGDPFHVWAPSKPRTYVTCPVDGGRIMWHNFVATGYLR